MMKWLRAKRDSEKAENQGLSSEGIMILPDMEAEPMDDEPIDPLEGFRKPGFVMCPFVSDFVETDAGWVPQVHTSLTREDILSTVRVRLGIGRNRYGIAPGLYCVGNPDRDSEVLVTANFKLTFDCLRKELEGIDAWILVLDTKGINVWCAAGKGTFSTREVVKRVADTLLERVVAHKRLIVPQLGATGVSAPATKKESGFSVVFGPIRAEDIPRFLENDRKVEKGMRQVTFPFLDRLILTPIEMNETIKPAIITALVLYAMSYISADAFAVVPTWSIRLIPLWFLLAGVFSGAVFTPAFLPFIPFRPFSVKGLLSGIVFAAGVSCLVSSALSPAFLAALSLFTVVISSYLAMNFTGATPITSPSGVEKEMKRFIPVQAVGLVLSIGLWVYAAFL